MRTAKTALGLGVAIVAMLVTGAALAHGGWRYGHGSRAHFGFYFGAPAYWYYPAPYYYPPAYYPPVVGAPAQPTVYIERGNGASQPEQTQGQWYFCPETNAYYPYVKQCAGGWQRVPAQPQS